MPGWNFADAWEVVATQVPDADAQVQGERHVSWTEFNRRANGVAQAMLAAGVSEQDQVAQSLYNCPDYLESILAAFKAGQGPFKQTHSHLAHALESIWGTRQLA